MAQAALNLSDPVPVGPQVQVGHLDNGLTYYIQQNSRPEKRLELRLVVKAGSVLEDDDQRGLAHFVEHMAFNGSTHFKKHELISYLQSIGLKFGADLNAYTSFNETVYILPLPTDKREAVEKGFLVLADWAGGLSFQDPDIDSERSIVLEELRLGKGAQDRMNKLLFPKIFSGSKYAERLPIGTEDILKGFKYETVKRFYKDWYRPDLMAVVVVGDIEPADARALIQANFSQLQNPPSERPRTYPELPVRTVSEAVVATDKEATNNVIQLLSAVMVDKPEITLADVRQKTVERLFGMALGQRMQELTQQASPPFVGGGSALSAAAPGYRWFGSSALLGRQGSEPAIAALLQENERARQFGFNPEELERNKKNLLRGYEQGVAELGKTNSANYAAEYIRNFLVKEPIPGIANELAYAQEMLPGISLAEVNAFARSVIPNKAARLVVYAGTDNADSQTPKGDQLLASVQQAERTPVVAKVEKALAKSFMSQLPTPGRIVAERRNEAMDFTELDLSNGVKVILKTTDFKNDEILLGAGRFGGQSLYPVADKFNAGYTTAFVNAMGMANFAPIELQKMLAGKVLSLSANLDAEKEWVGGNSSNADLESLLQLVHLKFGSMRRDADLFESMVTRSRDASKSAMASPQAIYHDALQTTLYNGHPRVFLTARPENFEGLQLDRIQAIYDQRFASAKGFTFILVGSFKPELVKPLLATYLASLPVGDLPTQYLDLGIRPVTGVVKKEVRAGTEPKATVSITFTGPATDTPEERMRVSAMVDVLNIKIIDVLREKLTLIYGGGIRGGLNDVPYPNYHLSMSLPCGPDNVDKVIAAAMGEIQKLQDAGPDTGDLDKVKKNWLIAHRRSLRENGYWLDKLHQSVLYGRDLAKVLSYEKDVAALSASDVQAAAKRYLRQDNYVQVVLLPKP
ncbi:MAG: insulinase family protein [Betaproteobacteria bacterium]